MLFIITGLVGELGKKSKQFFISKGIDGIKKKVYIPPKLDWNMRAEKTEVCKDLIEDCDFTYHNNGRIIGFNQQDFFDAVWGKKDSFLTISPEDVEFIREIKSAYHTSVNTIFVYVENSTLEETISRYEGIDDEEKNARLALGHRLKSEYLENADLFDDLVVFDDKEHGFGFDALYRQYDSIIECARRQRSETVEMPYTGKEPYLFISYDHDDTDEVMAILGEMQAKKYRVWFDKGIKGGDNWRNIVANKISNCDQFILFSSKNSINSRHVKAEINCALNSEKDLLTVRLDEERFDMGIEMYLTISQYINQSSLSFYDEFFNCLSEKTRAVSTDMSTAKKE